MASPNSDGARGEALAATYLERKGFRILARNYRIRQGEIDLVAADAEYLLFVEVKTRKAGAWLRGEEAVDAHKQARLLAAAEHYLSREPCEQQPRFDVICLELQDDRCTALRWHKNAF
ncbi:MAG: YraN family protein [Oscillospiraceae bacterium]|jgi:putative endonuclease|nr:YraN family protein [Oscillospiraceae bacterium]